MSILICYVGYPTKDKSETVTAVNNDLRSQTMGRRATSTSH